MTSPQLKLVPPLPEAPIDITALQRLDIARRDWSRVMIEGDRAPAINLGDGPRWRWR